MGIFFSRFCGCEDSPWHYLLSLLRFCYLRLLSRAFYRSPKRVSRPGSTSSGTDRPAFGTIGTQTYDDPTVAAFSAGQDVDTTTSKLTAAIALHDVDYGGVFEGNLQHRQAQPHARDYFAEKGPIHGPGRFHGENGKVSVEDGGEVTMSVSANDFVIFEDPDFSQFGPAYLRLMSPSDSQRGEEVQWKGLRMSCLSPVKEEDKEWDVLSSQNDDTMGRATCIPSRLKDPFPVFEEACPIVGERTAPGHFTCRPHDGPTTTITTTTPGSGKKIRCSLSSDSGIGDKLQCSNTSSSSSVCPSSSSSSESCDDCNSSSHSSDIASCNGDAQDKAGRCTESSVSDVFSHDGHVNAGFESEEPGAMADPGLDRPDVSQRRSLRAKVGALRQLNFRARRKVMFPTNVPSNSTSSCLSDCSEAVSPVSSPSSFCKSFHPIDSQTDCEETASSTSSDDSVLGFPLSPPTSPSSPCGSSTFVFQDGEKHCFSEHRKGCDLILMAEGERFHVHSSVVAWQCNSLLTHLRQTGAHEVVLADKRAQDVLCLLRLLYPFHSQTVNERNVESLVQLAHYLGCERVLRMCSSYLVSLAHFPHLCVHRQPLHHHARHHTPRRTAAGLGTDSPSRGKSPYKDQKSSSLCACAESKTERVMEILTLAAKYGLDDVYQAYLNVTANTKAADLLACHRYKHLSTALREDVLQSRVRRLERVVEGVSLKESHLRGCDGRHHVSCRVTYRGQICLRCVSRSVLRHAQNSAE